MTLLSPRQVATALGVSESSLKRWVDAGRLVATKTEGGHRKISVAEALRFVRENNAPLARPELLELPAGTTVSDAPSTTRGDAPSMTRGDASIRTVDATTSEPELLSILLRGDATAARAWLLGRYLDGASIAELADGPIRTAMHALGELWRHDQAGIFVEHRGTDCCLQAVAHLRTLVEQSRDLRSVATDARRTKRLPRVAVGGAPEDDPYVLPSFLAATVAASVGMRAVNLGPTTPVHAFEAAIVEHRPSLVWLSMSTPVSSTRIGELAALVARVPTTTIVALGGRASTAVLNARVHGGYGAGLVRERTNVRACESMADLAALAK
ncbi:MAG TPA: helix-turn-helix domain-containing protein [Kofleriaceae bacterium]